MRDYFKEAIISKNTDEISPDIAELINTDINNYREYMVKQYNGDEEQATDKFCFKKFLNEYSTAINVFGLHQDNKEILNKYIERHLEKMYDPRCETYKEIFFEVYKNMEFGIEYTIDEIIRMCMKYQKCNNSYYSSNNLSGYITQLIKDGKLKRLRRGVYIRIK